MKHIRLFDKKESLMQDITTNPSADYPIIALYQNEDDLSFWDTPTIKAKFNITSDDDVKSCILSDYNIKSLTIDGELKFKKDTWVKYEYQITQDDFRDLDNISLDRIVRPEIYVKLNSGCRNVYLKSDEKATQFLLFYPTNNGNYDWNYIDTNFINIEETKESLFIKQIDEYTYDLTNFYLYYDKTINNGNQDLVGIFLADSEGNVLNQNLEFECFDVSLDVLNEQIEHYVTKENAFNTDILFGPIVDISGDINAEDYIQLALVINGEMDSLEPLKIADFINYGYGNLSNNILHIDLTGLFGSEIGFLYVILDESYVSAENKENIVDFVKNCTITTKKPFNYTPSLSVGEHDIEIELLQLLYTPFFNKNALVDLDMLHVNGKYIHINNMCRGANKLKQVYLPNSLNSIGYGAFYDCSGLTSITIPDSVTEIGNGAFENCSSLTSVTIPNSVTRIFGYAFSNCSSLTSITIPSSVTNIGYGAFWYCTSLTSITCLATTAPTLGSIVFSNLPANGKLYVPSGSNYSSWLSKLGSGWTIENI